MPAAAWNVLGLGLAGPVQRCSRVSSSHIKFGRLLSCCCWQYDSDRSSLWVWWRWCWWKR
jgi:hypothetical protein